MCSTAVWTTSDKYSFENATVIFTWWCGWKYAVGMWVPRLIYIHHHSKLCLLYKTLTEFLAPHSMLSIIVPMWTLSFFLSTTIKWLLTWPTRLALSSWATALTRYFMVVRLDCTGCLKRNRIREMSSFHWEINMEVDLNRSQTLYFVCRCRLWQWMWLLVNKHEEKTVWQIILSEW